MAGARDLVDKPALEDTSSGVQLCRKPTDRADSCRQLRRDRKLRPLEPEIISKDPRITNNELEGNTQNRLRIPDSYQTKFCGSNKSSTLTQRPTTVMSAVAFFESKINEQFCGNTLKVVIDKPRVNSKHLADTPPTGGSTVDVVQRSCQHSDRNNRSDTNSSCENSPEINISCCLLRRGKVRCRRGLYRNLTHCYHYPTQCPCDEKPISPKGRSHSDQYFNNLSENSDVNILQKLPKIEENINKFKRLSMRRLKDIKERGLNRKSSKKDAALAEQKENIPTQVVRRTSSKRRRFMKVKRERRQHRGLDIDLLKSFLNISNKVSCCSSEESSKDRAERLLLEGGWRIRMDVCRDSLTKMIRRVENILDYFLNKQVLDHCKYYHILADACKMHNLLLNFVVKNDAEVYQHFVDALKETNQHHLISLLEDEDYVLDISHHVIISDNIDRLLSDLIIDDDLLGRLKMRKLLLDEECEQISGAKSSNAKSRKLLHFIYRSSRSQFETFRDVLSESHCEPLSELLEIPES